MGYYAQYLSTIFKGDWATTVKERLESRKAINNLRASDKQLYKKLPELVEKEHKVTKALWEEDKVIRELKHAAANGYTLAFNVSTMDMKILEAVNKLVDAWNKLHEIGKKISGGPFSKRVENLSKLFVNLLYKAIKKAEDEERSEYKDVLVIVNESAKKDHSQFMQAVRLRFQSLESQSMLAKLAIRTEIRRERRFIKAIENIAKKCEVLIKTVESSKTKIEQRLNVLNQFEAFAKESANDIEKAFYEAYLIKKRDFLLILKVIVNANVLKQLNTKWVVAHFMPEAPVKQKEIDVDKIEEKISEEFHTIAQALRISMKGLQDVESKLARAS